MKYLVLLFVLPALCLGQMQPQRPGQGMPGQGMPGQGMPGQGMPPTQNPQFPQQPSGSPMDAKCKGGWFLIGSQCFKMMPRALKWENAELMCEQNAPCGMPVLGGVMSIPDLQTSNALINHLRSLSTTPNRIDVEFWTGLSNKWNPVLERYEGWKWPSGYSTTQQPLPFVNWARGEPNNQCLDQQHSCCAVMNHFGQWVVRRCEQPYYFMCSMPATLPAGAAGTGPAMLMDAPQQMVEGGNIRLENGLIMRSGVGGP